MRFDQPPVLENINKSSIVQLSLKEKGLSAVIKDITGGPSGINDFLGNVLRVSDGGELDLSGLPPATYTLHIFTDANSSIPLKETQIILTDSGGKLLVEPAFVEVPSTPPALLCEPKPPIVHLSLREDGLVATIKDIRNGPANANEWIGHVIKASDVGELNLTGLPPGIYTLQLSNEANPTIPLGDAQVTLTATSLSPGGSRSRSGSGPLTVEPVFVEVLPPPPVSKPTLTLLNAATNKGLIATIKARTGGTGECAGMLGTTIKATENGELDLGKLPAGTYVLQIYSEVNPTIPLREVQVIVGEDNNTPGLLVLEPSTIDFSLPSSLPLPGATPAIVKLNLKEKGLVAIVKDITKGPIESVGFIGSVIKVSESGELDMTGLPMGTYTLKLSNDTNTNLPPREVQVTLSPPTLGRKDIVIDPPLLEVPILPPAVAPALPSNQKSSTIQLSPSVRGLIATIKDITDGPKNTAGLIESIILASDTGELDMDGFPTGTYTLEFSADSDPDIPLCQVTVKLSQPSGKNGLLVVEPFFVEVPVAVPDLPTSAKTSIIQLNPREKGLIATIKNVVGPEDIDDLLEGIIRASDTGELDLDGLPPGLYTLQISTDANPDFPLSEVEVALVQSADGVGPPVVEPSTIDLDVTPMVFGFRKADQPFTQAMVKAVFIPKGSEECFPLHKVTDSSGKVSFLLPAGTIKPGMTAVRADRSVVSDPLPPHRP